MDGLENTFKQDTQMLENKLVAHSDKSINSLIDIDHELEEKARRRAREKGSMLAHLILFVSGNLILIVGNAIEDWGNWWFFPITLGWIIGLCIHFLSTFLFNGLIANYIEVETEREMKKERIVS